MITTAASSGCRNHTTKDFRERFSKIFDTTLAVGLAVKEILGLGRQGLEQLYISCRPELDYKIIVFSSGVTCQCN